MLFAQGAEGGSGLPDLVQVDEADWAEREVVVEANTPTEAVVKFQHAHAEWRHRARGDPHVTSVQAEQDLPKEMW